VQGTSKSFENTGAVAYLFGFNGQEKDDEITQGQYPGSHTTALFWEYDTRIGRRWNLDPKPQISISDYACFSNNPIWFNDPLGDKWKDPDKDQATADEMKGEFKKRQINYEKNASKALKAYEMNIEKGDEEAAQKNYKDYEFNISGAGEMSQAQKELDVLRDNQDYTFTFKQITGDVGRFKKEGDVWVISHTRDMGTKAHESKHGFQLIQGAKQSLTTERGAYIRQFYTTKLTMPSSKGLYPQKDSDITFEYIRNIKDDEGKLLYKGFSEFDYTLQK